MHGIVGYGSYVPRFRIKAEDIAHQWGADAEAYKRGLLLEEKTVPGPDEDTITISVAAARYAVTRAGIDPQKIGACYIGSESHPYAVKPSGTVLIDAIGAGPECHVADFEFACKAGTEAMYVAYSHVKSGEMEYALGIGADTSQGAAGDALEYTASAGGAAYIMGAKDVAAEITCTVLSATRGILAKSGLKPSDFRFAIFHMPNGKFPLRAGKILGFEQEQLEQGWVVNLMGNTYSGSSPTGLAACLDVAKPDDQILITSFGSGAASDSFVLRCTDRIAEIQDLAPKVRDQLRDGRIHLDYGKYVAYRGKIRVNEI